MVSIANVRVPVTLAFGPTENSEQHGKFSRVLEMLHQINPNQYLVLTRYDGATEVICATYGDEKVLCWHHLLVSLREGIFGSHLKNLIQGKGAVDFRNLMTIHEGKSRDITDSEEVTRRETENDLCSAHSCADNRS
jgi:hypothetical protein